jgi:uncharacterized sporulation protein YeaH/YhbH (DUF444 family)
MLQSKQMFPLSRILRLELSLTRESARAREREREVDKARVSIAITYPQTTSSLFQKSIESTVARLRRVRGVLTLLDSDLNRGTVLSLLF